MRMADAAVCWKLASLAVKFPARVAWACNGTKACEDARCHSPKERATGERVIAPCKRDVDNMVRSIYAVIWALSRAGPRSGVESTPRVKPSSSAASCPVSMSGSAFRGSMVSTTWAPSMNVTSASAA